MKNILLIAIIIISTLTSCDIQKKRYSRGYTISKNRNYISSVKKNKDIKTSQNSEISKISPPIISKVNQEPLITNIVIQNKVKLANKNEEKLEIVDIYQSEKKGKFSSILAATTKSQELNNSNIKRNQSKKTNDPDTPKKQVNKNSIIALAFILLPIVGFVVSYIFAVKALKQIKLNPNKFHKSSKDIAILAMIPFYITLLLALVMSIVLILYGGIIFIILSAVILLIAALPMIYLNSVKTKNSQIIDDKSNSKIKPKTEEKITTENKIKGAKKSLSKNNKLLIFFILLFSSMLLIPLTFNS
jgi:hypothetical protein